MVRMVESMKTKAPKIGGREKGNVVRKLRRNESTILKYVVCVSVRTWLTQDSFDLWSI